ncbi:hypothetical protein SLEP1_g19609 [Rubroshorea leprosula]|uniref:Uncharacterized protein n=1 Tax=Rubroshorea leprosula TaxID=152421 RepID=A0AAV5J5Y8_9ROSI|nr:hypothetical protein SLEP1_g19609 [Rubroshorea leprosula]
MFYNHLSFICSRDLLLWRWWLLLCVFYPSKIGKKTHLVIFQINFVFGIAFPWYSTSLKVLIYYDEINFN